MSSLPVPPWMSRRRILGAGVLVAIVALAGVLAFPAVHTARAAAPRATAHATSLPPIKHVFVLIDENESASTTFGAGSPAPYLSQTLKSEGAYVPNYYGIGHSSLDNYIAMVSGQAPNVDTQNDCSTYADTFPNTMTNGQEDGEGCIYPSDVPSLMSQMDKAGLTWRGYMDDMPAACTHVSPGQAETYTGESATDQYATRHNPFVYFHYVTDNPTECNADDVNLDQLSSDLQSASTTPNYSFITPDVCDDGHDGPGAASNCNPGGLAQADQFLKTWVPKIMASPAYQQNGLLIITFDEAATSDASACCNEQPGPGEALPGETGAGGGQVGAVLLSRYIAPGTVTQTAYNHYSMLASVEDLFGLPHIGYAAQSGLTDFGSDIFTNPSGAPIPTTSTATTTTTTPSTTTTSTTKTATTPTVTTPIAKAMPQDTALKLKPSSVRPSGTGKARQPHGTTITYTDSQAGVTAFTVARLSSGYRRGAGPCRALAAHHSRPRGTKACTATTTVDSFTHRDTTGINHLVFNGRAHGHALSAGSYTLMARPTLNSTKGATVSVRFRVI